jgi:hypothetical protein
MYFQNFVADHKDPQFIQQFVHLYYFVASIRNTIKIHMTLSGITNPVVLYRKDLHFLASPKFPTKKIILV